MKKIDNKKIFRYIFTSIIILFLSFSIFAYANAQVDVCEQFSRRCNPVHSKIVQICSNCDIDPELEWCNQQLCEGEDNSCNNGNCQKITCKTGQLIGDVNGDGFLSQADYDLLLLISDDVLAIPEDKCCSDLNKDEVVTIEDAGLLDNILKGEKNNLGFCGDIKCNDNDGDGYTDILCGGKDCDDSNNGINPDAEEICDNGIDDDCSEGDCIKPICKPNNNCIDPDDEYLCPEKCPETIIEKSKDIKKEKIVKKTAVEKTKTNMIIIYTFIGAVILISAFFLFLKNKKTINK